MSDEKPSDFEALVAPYHAELRAHCYRMLGSLHDADDALQEALLGAWRGLPGFEGRSTLRSWLYRIATHACLRIAEQRPKRILPLDRAAAASGIDLDPMVREPIWLEPYPTAQDTPDDQRESLELAFIAALQHLAPLQRASLILREVLGFSAAEVAALLETTVPAINSALQRARDSVARKVPPLSQQATLRALGDAELSNLVASYVAAWERQDVTTLVSLLADDARFTMPPIPTWFHGREAIRRFFAERVFATPWRLRPMQANGQLAFACYQGPDVRLGALNVIALQGREIKEITGFLDPAVHALFSLPER